MASDARSLIHAVILEKQGSIDGLTCMELTDAIIEMLNSRGYMITTKEELLRHANEHMRIAGQNL